MPGLSRPAARRCENKHWFLVSDLAGIAARPAHRASPCSPSSPCCCSSLTYFVLWRTAFGLRLRSCGESPIAAESLGVNVYLYKYCAVIVSGAFAGLGGAFLAIVAGTGYREGQTGGRGYIGLAAMIFGNWRPGGLAAGAGLFGYTDALQLRSGGASVHALLLLARVLLLVGCAIWTRVPPARSSAAVIALVVARCRAGLVPHHRRGARRLRHVHPVRRHAAGAGARLAAAAAAGGRRHALPAGPGWLTPSGERRLGRRCARRPRDVMHRAYAPYSDFPVGAAGLVDDGRIVVGVQRRERVLRRRAVRRVRPGVGAARQRRRPAGRRRVRRPARQHADAVRPLPPAAVGERRPDDCCVDTVRGIRPMTEVLPDAFGPEDLVATSDALTAALDAVDVIRAKRDGGAAQRRADRLGRSTPTPGARSPTSRCRRWRWRSCSTGWTATRSPAGPRR